LKLQDRIYFLPAVSPNEIVSLCRVAQAGIASIRNVCESYYLSLPNKIFEYIHAGIPVLVNNLPEMAALVKNQKIGLCFDINTVSSIVDTIHQMYEDTEHYNQFCKNAVTASQTLNWECEQKQLLQLYKGLVSA
ncbi:MAG: glycosyltransferase, partial [Candidatus Marinimicrobia bacterium]|jgi:glycosyltransferase involved in cell wall biosynthesis|nr:glycosyltransferase [Candidatus Neomarinimicrobiota bacterium]